MRQALPSPGSDENRRKNRDPNLLVVSFVVRKAHLPSCLSAASPSVLRLAANVDGYFQVDANACAGFSGFSITKPTIYTGRRPGQSEDRFWPVGDLMAGLRLVR
jgi:hypothetical protein